MILQERKLTNIHLGGELGKRFGENWRLAVTSPAEAIRAIDINTKGRFKHYLGVEGKADMYKVSIGGIEENHALSRQEIRNKSGYSDIYFMPVIGGANSGSGKIIAGVVLLVVSLAISYFSGGTVNTENEASPLIWGGTAISEAGTSIGTSAATASFAASAAASITFSLGTSLILGGIAQLLAPNRTQGGELNSNIFAGTIAAGTQGGSVPVVYGKALVAPTPISIWFNNVDYNTTQNAYVGFAVIGDLPGGGHQYLSSANASNPVHQS